MHEFFAKYLEEIAIKVAGPARVLSLGSGNCSHEIDVGALLQERGLSFSIECFELNEHFLEQGRVSAASAGLLDRFRFTSGNLNVWRPEQIYHGIMAFHSLHHVVELESVFDNIRGALDPTCG